MCASTLLCASNYHQCMYHWCALRPVVISWYLEQDDNLATRPVDVWTRPVYF